MPVVCRLDSTNVTETRAPKTNRNGEVSTIYGVFRELPLEALVR